MRMCKMFYFFYLSLIFILCGCYDPVFYAISQEVKPIEPRINGAPTNFVIFDGSMFVASGTVLFSYNKGTDENPDEPYWKKETSPGGNILQIAATDGNLYALCTTDPNNNGKTVLKRFDKENSSWSTTWSTTGSTTGGILNDYAKLQNIFAVGDVLFVLATLSVTNYDYNILCIKDDGTDAFNISGREDTGIITGAAFNGTSYFLPFTSKKSDNGKVSGVYKIDVVNNDAKIIMYKNKEGTDTNVHFNGIINLEDSTNTILLMARNGEIYIIIDETIVKIEKVSMGRMSTGALAIWQKKDEPDKRLLLAGRQDSLYYSSTYGYSYGYMELELDAAGIKTGSNFVEPGKIKNLSTLTDNERYQSTIGKNPINYIFQVPSEIDGNMILFAATQKSGVWSCRIRNGKEYWNSEGEDEPEKYYKKENEP